MRIYLLLPLIVMGCASQTKLTKNMAVEKSMAHKNHRFILRTSQSLGMAKKKLISSHHKPLARPEHWTEQAGIFTEALAAFEVRDRGKFVRASKMLEQQYPDSEFIEQLYFLRGKWALADADYKEALKSFETVLQNYPLSHRAVSALYAKGMTYQHMNLEDSAKEVFTQVKQMYPGSLEAKRSDVQLKMVER